MKLPTSLKPKQIVKALKKAGFVHVHTVGSHYHFKHPDGRRTQVAMHNRPLPPGTLKAILHQTGFSIEDLKKLL